MGVTAVLLSGCASPSADSDDIQLDVWTHEFEPLQTAFLEKWIPEFEADNPDISVNLTTVPLAGVVTYDAKLLSSLSTGTGPDLWDMGDWNFQTMLDNDYLAPIDPETFGYSSQEELLGHYAPGVTTAIERDGTLYSIVSEFNTLRTFYNKKVFEEAGIPELSETEPISWDEVGQIGQELLAEDNGQITRMGLQLGFFANYRAPQWYAQNFYTLMRQYGQDDLYVDGQPAADTKPVIDALTLLSTLTHEDRAYDPTFVQNWFADLPQGRVAMVQAGTWYPGAAAGNAEGGSFEYGTDFGVAPVPVVDPQDPATYKDVSWLWGWAVNAASPDPEQEAAQEFLAFITGKAGETEQAEYWFSELGYLQPSNDFLDSAAYTGAVTEQPWLQQFIDVLDTYEVSPVPHSTDLTGEALIRAIDKITYDNADPTEVAQELQTELERLPQQ